MTTTTEPDLEQPDAAPAPFDPLAALTIAELDDGSRQLRASIVAAITQQSEHYEKALALVAWLHARRAEPGVAVGRFLRLTFVELQQQLSELGPADEGPTTPGPG